MRRWTATARPRASACPWAAGERILVGVGPRSDGESLVRAGKRLAAALHAEWIVVYVETPDLIRLPEAERNRRIAWLRLAETLGAETVTLGGPSAGAELVALRADAQRDAHPARRTEPQGLGALAAAIDRRPGAGARPRHRRHRRQDDRGDARSRKSPLLARSARLSDAPPSRQATLAAVRRGRAVGVAAATALAWVTTSVLNDPNVVMIYLLAIALVAWRFGRGPSVLASIASARGLQLLLRAAAVHFERRRRPVPDHLRGADCGRHPDRHADGKRAAAGARRRPSRAAHGAAVRDEPRTGGHARRRWTWRGLPCVTSARFSRHRSSCCCRTTHGALRMPRGEPEAGIAARRRPVGRAMGAGARAAGGTRHRHAARRGGALPAADAAAMRRARRARRAGGAAGESAPDPAARAGAPARHLCRPARAGARARPAGRAGAGGDGGRRDRVGAQQPAGGHLARHAHAAGGDRRRRQQPGASRTRGCRRTPDANSRRPSSTSRRR